MLSGIVLSVIMLSVVK
jgi:hypothetical protein